MQLLEIWTFNFYNFQIVRHLKIEVLDYEEEGKVYAPKNFLSQKALLFSSSEKTNSIVKKTNNLFNKKKTV